MSARKPDSPDAQSRTALPWPSVVAALLAGIAALALVSWVGANLVI